MTPQNTLHIQLLTFGYKRGAPENVALVMDVRFLNNPFYMPELEPMSGLDAPVAEFIAGLPETDAVFKPWQAWLLPWLTAFAQKGHHTLTLAIGCTGGKHRSVYWAERTASWLKEVDTIAALPVRVTLSHRDQAFW
jgi:UPF0042 nucleotide-binding protein